LIANAKTVVEVSRTPKTSNDCAAASGPVRPSLPVDAQVQPAK
jgi:hypothetical protein